MLLAVGHIISIGITHGEFFFFDDEMPHAITGVFFRDLIVDRPWSNPVQYAYEYYAKYPSPGLLYWWPLFHIVEGLFFLAFGISVLASRLTILSYALVGVFFWYKIAEREGPQPLSLQGRTETLGGRRHAVHHDSPRRHQGRHQPPARARLAELRRLFTRSPFDVCPLLLLAICVATPRR